MPLLSFEMKRSPVQSALEVPAYQCKEAAETPHARRQYWVVYPPLSTEPSRHSGSHGLTVDDGAV